MKNETELKKQKMILRIEKLKKQLDIFEKMCTCNNYIGDKRRIASHVYSIANYDSDIIYQICLIGFRDCGEAINDFIKRKDLF